ncbi:hypothetical protein ABBQ32_011065 [Trebouxia sp. C0010 RCD-2024]
MACHGLVSGSLTAATGKHTCSRSPRWAGCGVFSAKRSAFRGSQSGLHHAKLGSRVTVMAKEGLHPEYFPDAKVFCNGEEVLTTSGTRGEYTVDIWSGNHPFFQGSNNSVILDEGRVNKFNKRFAGLEGTLGQVGTGGGKKLSMSKINIGKGKDKKKKKR